MTTLLISFIATFWKYISIVAVGFIPHSSKAQSTNIVRMDSNGYAYIGNVPALDSVSTLSSSLSTKATVAFSQISTVTVNTTSETSIKGNIVGNDTLKVTDFKAGKTWIGFQNGTYSTPVVTVGNLVVKVYLGNTVILTNTISNLPVNISSGAYTSHIQIVCRSTGSSGQIAASGYVEFTAGTSLTTLKLFFPPTVTTMDLTGYKIYNPTVQYSSSGNTLLSVNQTLISLN